LSAGAQPQTPLGELTALPKPPSWILGGLLLRGREGTRGEERGGESTEKEEKGKGRGGMGKGRERAGSPP